MSHAALFLDTPSNAHREALEALEGVATEQAWQEDGQDAWFLPRADVQEVWEEGRILYLGSDFRASAVLFDKLHLRVENPLVRCIVAMNAGLAYAAAGDLDSAQDLFIMATKSWPYSGLPVFLAGVVAYAQARYQTAHWMFKLSESLLGYMRRHRARSFAHLGFPFVLGSRAVFENRWLNDSMDPMAFPRPLVGSAPKLPHLLPFGCLFDSERAYNALELGMAAMPKDRAAAQSYRSPLSLAPETLQLGVFADPSAAGLSEQTAARDSLDVDWSFPTSMPVGWAHGMGEKSPREGQGAFVRTAKGAISSVKHWFKRRDEAG